ncbi:protein of unknown function [Streptantibioticus cattleyicolor NRRL 8057 = DSM 46488]|nr:protein of unknown function [Streptantibioticus cattleyicolor NRRL 8057 = DSM 46488]
MDVYADQTLLDAFWGRAGRGPNAPVEGGDGPRRGGIPQSGGQLTPLAGAPARTPGGAPATAADGRR